MDIESLLTWIFTIIGGIAGIVAIIKYLEEHPSARPKKWIKSVLFRKIKVIRQYLKDEMDRIFLVRAPGSNLKIGDIIKDGGIFIDPLWTKYQDDKKKTLLVQTPSISLVNYAVEKIEKGAKLLLLGEPGQGKSTLMQRIFVVMATRFLNNQSRIIPVYISCRQLVLRGEGPITLEDIFRSETNPLPFTHRDLKRIFQNNVVLVFDGLDEIGGTLQQNIIHQRTDSNIFLLPGIVSCRMNFFQSYLSDLDNKLTRNTVKIELCPLDIQLVHNYIKANCQVTGHKDMAESLFSSIGHNKDLSDLSRRFISLVMMVDLFPTEAFDPGESWSITKLYEEYSRKWLSHEALKHKGLDWNQKSVIMEKIAWEVHTTKLPSTLAYGENMFLTISRVELENLLSMLTQRLNLSIPDLLNDICYRAFLVNEGENFYFIHRSFQEFYVAKYIYRSMTLDLPQAIPAMREFLPVEIASYLKDMLKASSETVVEIISDNLIQIYQGLQNDTSPESVTTLEHASYYVGTLYSARVERFLEESFPKEKREWIRRGMIIDLIYTYKKRELLRQYLKELRQDAHVDTVNLGYHLEYYGDQAPQGDHTDKMGVKCDRTIRAIGRHLKDPKKHEIGWALDIYTLRRIIETRLKLMPAKSIIPESEIAFIKEFLNRAHAFDKELEREARQLSRLIQKENIL